MACFLISIILIALASAFVLTLAYKLGVIEWMQVHGDKIISQMANCDFCLSFWSNVIVCMVVMLVVDDVTIGLAPVFSTMITRKLL
jgi:hypothetical protein